MDTTTELDSLHHELKDVRRDMGSISAKLSLHARLRETEAKLLARIGELNRKRASKIAYEVPLKVEMMDDSRIITSPADAA